MLLCVTAINTHSNARYRKICPHIIPTFLSALFLQTHRPHNDNYDSADEAGIFFFSKDVKSPVCDINTSAAQQWV